MDGFFDAVAKVNDAINSVVWGVPMLILIICTGIYMTVRTRFFQITKIKHWLDETILAIFKKKSVRKTKEKKAITQFQALSTALAATIGTGNIAGVATAIAIGGPGAVFWMWISAFFGMMTNYSENVLGIFYRRKNTKGEWSGGAMYYLQDGLGKKKGMKIPAKVLAILFAIFCVFASFGIGNMTQVNSISSAMYSNFNVPTLITGIALALLCALVVVGGIKRIGSVTEKLVPFMAAFYIIGCLIIFFSNFSQIPYVFSSIFENAFNFNAIAGGVGGYVLMRAITMGFKRGVFSNEAGLGSSVMVHSASDVKEPVVQGMWGIFEVFFDTIIVCTLTAFVLLSSPAGSQTFDQAINNISTEGQYFEIHTAAENQVVSLIDDNVNLKFVVVGDDADEGTYKVVNGKTSYGTDVSFKLSTVTEGEGESDYTYANVMEIKGIQKTDENGNKMVDENGNPIIGSVEINEVNGVPLVTYAFSMRLGDVAGKILAIAILLFAFSTVLGWSFYGTKALEYLFGTKATIVYKVIFVLFVVVGCTMNLQLAWDIADTLNALMAIPNLIGVLMLSGVVVKITRNYVGRKMKNSGEKPMLSVIPEVQAEQEAKLDEE